MNDAEDDRSNGRGAREKLPDIFTALFEAGTKDKDTAALSLLVNRAVPVRKGVPVNFKTRPLSNPSECAEAFGHILAAIGKGELTPDEVEIDPGFPQGSRQDARSPTPGSRRSAFLMRFARRRGGRGRQQRRERFEQLRRLAIASASRHRRPWTGGALRRAIPRLACASRSIIQSRTRQALR